MFIIYRVKADSPKYQSFKVKGSMVIVKLIIQPGRLTALKAVSVPHTVAVRYVWEGDPADANVYNSIDLPLFSFRTDFWKGLTDDNK